MIEVCVLCTCMLLVQSLRYPVHACSTFVQFDPPRYPRRLENAWNRNLRSVQLESGSFVIFMMGSWFIRLMDVFCYWFLRRPSVKWWQDVFFSQVWAMPPCLLHGWSAFDAFVQARLSTETLVLCIVILILGWWIVEGMLRLKGHLWSSEASIEVHKVSNKF